MYTNAAGLLRLDLFGENAAGGVDNPFGFSADNAYFKGAFDANNSSLFRAGVQRDADEATRAKAEEEDEAVQNYADAMAEAAAYREQWRAERHQLGDLNLTGAEYDAISQQIENDPEFRRELEDRVEAAGGQRSDVDKYKRWNMLGQKGASRTAEEEEEYRRLSQNRGVQIVGQEGNRMIDNRRNWSIHTDGPAEPAMTSVRNVSDLASTDVRRNQFQETSYADMLSDRDDPSAGSRVSSVESDRSRARFEATSLSQTNADQGEYVSRAPVAAAPVAP